MHGTAGDRGLWCSRHSGMPCTRFPVCWRLVGCGVARREHTLPDTVHLQTRPDRLGICRPRIHSTCPGLLRLAARSHNVHMPFCQRNFSMAMDTVDRQRPSRDMLLHRRDHSAPCTRHMWCCRRIFLWRTACKHWPHSKWHTCPRRSPRNGHSRPPSWNAFPCNIPGKTCSLRFWCCLHRFQDCSHNTLLDTLRILLGPVARIRILFAVLAHCRHHCNHTHPSLGHPFDKNTQARTLLPCKPSVCYSELSMLHRLRSFESHCQNTSNPYILDSWLRHSCLLPGNHHWYTRHNHHNYRIDMRLYTPHFRYIYRRGKLSIALWTLWICTCSMDKTSKQLPLCSPRIFPLDTPCNKKWNQA